MPFGIAGEAQVTRATLVFRLAAGQQDAADQGIRPSVAVWTARLNLASPDHSDVQYVRPAVVASE